MHQISRAGIKGEFGVVDVFISYSRADKEKVGMLARMIANEGYDVWWDADLPPHMSYGDVITAKIGAAKAAVVVWSETAAQSEWVRAEADVARNQKKLIQTSLDDFLPPLPFNQIQYALLQDWQGEADHVGWKKVKQSLIALCGAREANDTGEVEITPAAIGAAAPPPPAPPPASPPPATTASVAQQNSNWPIFAGLAVALIALVSAVLIVFVALDDEDNGELPVAQASAEPVAEPDSDDGEADIAEEPETAPTQAPVPDRREWLFATVEDSDGFSNVRAGPTTRTDIVGTVREGETFSTWRQDGSWWQVELSDGTRGYIYRRLIRLLGNDASAAVGIPVDANGMLFADSSTRLLTPADLSGLTAGALRLARNEIYARKGFIFQDAALRAYFSRFGWYNPSTNSVTLNSVEESNVTLIRSAESRLGQ